MSLQLPTVSLEVAFSHGPTDPTPVWTPIDSDLQAFTTLMGRQHMLDRVNPTTLKATLDNRQGNYSPWDTNSPFYNLLSAVDSSLPTIGGWVATAGTVGIQSAQVLQGTSAGELTSTGGTATARTALVPNAYLVSPSTQYSAGAYFRAATTGQNVSVGFNFYNGSGFQIGSTVFGPAVADTTTGWTQATVTATPPSNAAFAAVVVSAASSGTLVHYFDCVMLCANPAVGTVTQPPIGWTLGQTLPLVPGKPVRLVATWATVPYPIFYGFADAWTPVPTDSLNQTATLDASDVLTLLNLKLLQNSTILPNTILASSPLAYWRMGDPVGTSTLADSSGNGQGAFVQGAVTYATDGLALYDPSTAVDFSGGTSAPSGVATPAVFTAASTSSFTIIGSIKTTATGEIVMQFQSGVSAGQLYVEALMVDFNGRVNLSSGQQPTPTLTNPALTVQGPIVNDGNPHWVAVTVTQSGGNATWGLTVDGVSYGTATNTFIWNGNLVVGGVLEYLIGAESFAPTFDGIMQDVAVFSGVLSSTVLTNIFTVGSYFQNVEYTGQRIAKALIVAGYGVYPQNLATGSVLCAPETASMTQTLCGDYCLEANDTENGLFYQDPSGTIQFKDRHYPQINSTSTASQATIGDNPSAPYHYDVTGLTIPQDALDLWPDVQTQRNNGVIQQVINAAAAAASGWRTLQRTGLLMNADPDALYLAQWLSYLYATPQIRVSSVLLSSLSAQGANLPIMLGLLLWESIIMQRQGSGESPFSQMNVIEGTAHNVDFAQGTWKTTWQLSPFEVSAKANAVLILNSSTLGILNTNVVGG